MKLTLLSLTSLLLIVSALPTPNDEPALSARQPHEIHQHHHHHHPEMTAKDMDNMVKRHEIHEHHHHHHADGTEMTAAEMENMKRGAHEGHLGEGMEEAREDVGDVYGKLW